MRVSAKLVGMADLERDLAKLRKGMQGQAVRSALRAAAKPILDQAKADAKSQRVKASLTAIARGQGTKAEARIGPKRKTPGARIAHLIEKGTKPHAIRARRQRFLARGRRVFGPAVQHPGMRARPFLKTALPKQRAEVERKFISALRQIVDKMALKMLKQQGRG